MIGGAGYLDITWSMVGSICGVNYRNGSCGCCCLGTTQELNSSRRAPDYFTLTGDKAPSAARNSSEVARA